MTGKRVGESLNIHLVMQTLFKKVKREVHKINTRLGRTGLGLFPPPRGRYTTKTGNKGMIMGGKARDKRVDVVPFL